MVITQAQTMLSMSGQRMEPQRFAAPTPMMLVVMACVVVGAMGVFAGEARAAEPAQGGEQCFAVFGLAAVADEEGDDRLRRYDQRGIDALAAIAALVTPHESEPPR